MKSKSKSFTLMELLIVVAIIGILASYLPVLARREKQQNQPSARAPSTGLGGIFILNR